MLLSKPSSTSEVFVYSKSSGETALTRADSTKPSLHADVISLFVGKKSVQNCKLRNTPNWKSLRVQLCIRNGQTNLDLIFHLKSPLNLI